MLALSLPAFDSGPSWDSYARGVSMFWTVDVCSDFRGDSDSPLVEIFHLQSGAILELSLSWPLRVRRNLKMIALYRLELFPEQFRFDV